jgi:hypothetical protein
MRVKPLLFGLATFMPGAYALLSKPTGGTDSPRYCYTVWLRHLITARAAGLASPPATVVELGPGDSIGVGLAALISGADRYYAIDAVRRARPHSCLRMFDALVSLFEQRAPLPDATEFPNVRPRLSAYAFPRDLLDDRHLADALRPERLAALRAGVAGLGRPGPPIHYLSPSQADAVPAGSVDLVMSQGVLQYAGDLPATYAQMFDWVRPGGLVSHAINFGAHQTSNRWDGHWAISDFGWACLRGRQPYFLNRAAHSHHLAALNAAGFEIRSNMAERRPPQTRRDRFVSRFAALSDADVTTSGAFIQAAKPGCVTRETQSHAVGA